MKYKVTLNGKTYEVEVEKGKAILLDEYEALAPAPAQPEVSAPVAPVQSAPAPTPAPVNLAAGETVSAPMPGNILRVDVKQGDTVKEGQILVILEAMKMENEIVAPKDGTVAQVVTSKGAVVDTGSPLVVIA
ncbi:MAG: biotin/lipoyl-binding protein [Ruminococcus flavefaciens]|nr:biotin/lipoyl-binding protein [Ruminococcus flavefaciens]MCM1229695.1 biotin/lipoyl-binding protein [Ruminococcus flavefaciens]